MKTKTLLLIFSIIFTTVSFSQDIIQTKEICFEGTVVTEYLGDGVFFITVKITKGDLIGKTERLYFSIGFGDKNQMVCKGNAKFDGAGYSRKKIKGKIIESTGEFENHEIGVETRKCYRPVELNWM